MKKYLLLVPVILLLLSCNDENKTEAGDESVSVKSDKALPYNVTYSSSFEIGNQDHVAPILQGSWKDWENNTLDNMRSWVADSIVAYHSDNSVVMGVDSLQARWKRNRAAYTSSIDTINAVMPVYSTDKKENWVLVWAKAIDTKADGTVDTSYIMETWRLNKDGKADMLFQFDRAKRKQ